MVVRLLGFLHLQLPSTSSAAEAAAADVDEQQAKPAPAQALHEVSPIENEQWMCRLLQLTWKSGRARYKKATA